mgnify:CR=1 FL=1
MKPAFSSLVLFLALGAAAQAGDPPQVGQPAPEFTLKDVDGKEHSLAALKGKLVVLEWFNPDCPYVKKHHQRAKTMKETAARFADKDVVWLAINSGAEGKQGAGPARNKQAREEYAITYPILLDMDGKVGRAYGATATPTMYVIDREGKLAYMGAIDDDKSPRKLGELNYVRRALEALLAGQPVPAPAATRAYG